MIFFSSFFLVIVTFSLLQLCFSLCDFISRICNFFLNSNFNYYCLAIVIVFLICNFFFIIATFFSSNCDCISCNCNFVATFLSTLFNNYLVYFLVWVETGFHPCQSDVCRVNVNLIAYCSSKVKSGANVLVCGPNGCGKSSLFRVLGEVSTSVIVRLEFCSCSLLSVETLPFCLLNVGLSVSLVVATVWWEFDETREGEALLRPSGET